MSPSMFCRLKALSGSLLRYGISLHAVIDLSLEPLGL
ncbi:MAG: hypothetical protein ACI82F_003854 [Planctomycetota bacterium]|jgi:hypothetical protein